MSTFDYLRAIWKNGPGLVSDAPAWVLREIERELPVWTDAHERELVGVHSCVQSNLVLGILVSPSASGHDSSLEDARHGSFIHVFATDHPDRATLRVDEVRELFESTYGAPISDGAVRQQRNFMLLDFPYHQDLARDLFIDKDRVEGGLDLAGPAPSSAFEETREGVVAPPQPHETPVSRPLPPASLSSLLSHHDPVLPSGGPDGLPFDQGLSYAEVIAGLRERLYGRPSPVERERTVGDPPAPERAVPSQSARVDALPLDQIAPARRAAPDVESAEADVGVADKAETELEVRNVDATRVLERRVWTPVYRVAGLLVAGLLVGGVIVLRLSGREPADVSPAERAAPLALLPDVSARLPARELAGLNRHTDGDVNSRIDALGIDAPELRPKAIPSAIELVTEQVEPDLPSIEPVVPIESAVIDEAEAELPVLASMKMKSAPEVAVRGAASGFKPAVSSVALEPAPAMARDVVVTEPDPASDEETSNASAEPAQAFDVAVKDTLSMPSSEILEESAATPLDETPAMNSTEAVAARSITVERGTKQRDGRRKRERKRVMGQINRYR